MNQATLEGTFFLPGSAEISPRHELTKRQTPSSFESFLSSFLANDTKSAPINPKDGNFFNPFGFSVVYGASIV